ncbi:MAG TPA: CopD family protein [Candidatus Acidoferrum sp.]|jgi:putative copper resistance protein D
MVSLLGIFGFFTVLLRALTLCFQSVAIGGILFFTLAARSGEERNEELLRSGWKLIRFSAIALAVTQVLFIILNSLVLRATVDIPLSEIVGANFVLAGALAIVASIAIALWPDQLRKNLSPVVLIPAAMMLASSVMTSHSASRMENRPLLVSLTVLHYLATASWIGGLPFLLLAMKKLPESDAKSNVIRRFSRLAQVSVALLIGAGVAMSWAYLGSIAAIYGTAYGVMISAKVALLLCLLLLGAANYYIVKGLDTSDAATGKRSLVRFGEAEIGIGLTVILAAASLTSQPPGIDLTQDRVTMHEIATRFAPRMPRFRSPELNELSVPTEQIYNEAKAAGQELPPAYVPGQTQWNPSTPGDIAWSEYNHNWAGLIVMLMGILALLSRSRYFAWAKIWPLMFLGLAVFLFLRADPENWPLGPNGFWKSFGVVDVLQHRLAVVLIVVFAIFQYRVETKKVKSMAAALVFPSVCALGGVVLLTHTHALSNVREEMLAELSHTPLAIFGIMAGWSRWLELRLPDQNQARKYLKWIWPVCFIFVGLILMDYHESDVNAVKPPSVAGASLNSSSANYRSTPASPANSSPAAR